MGLTMQETGIQSAGIEYRIYGEELQAVEITLPPGEGVIAEPGAMLAMDSNIRMEATLGDGSTSTGFFGKLGRAVKRAISGESLFVVTFENTGYEKGKVVFAAPYPGRILPVDLDKEGGEIICQKGAFLCGRKGLSVDIVFTRKIGAGLFGGEGFILQRIHGQGTVFLHAGGTIVEYQLSAGQTLYLDTGCLVALTPQVDYSVELIKGGGLGKTLKNILFGGEGIFLVKLTGPGKVWIQTMPFARLVERIAGVVSGKSKSRGEGSILGTIYDIASGD